MDKFPPNCQIARQASHRATFPTPYPVPESTIEQLLQAFAAEMAGLQRYPLPSWTKSPHGLELAKFPAPELILESLRAIAASPGGQVSGGFAMDWYLSPVIQGAARKKGEWDIESARAVLDQLHKMAERLSENIVTLSFPYPALAAVSAIDRAALDKTLLEDAATRLIDRYRTIALDRFKADNERLAQHPEFIPEGYTEAHAAAAEIKIREYPEQSFDSDGKKLIGILRRWLDGADAWEEDDWGLQAIPLLKHPENSREFELKLLSLYPKHSGRHEWALTTPRPGSGCFLGPNNLRRLMQAVDKLSPPLGDEEAQVIRDAMVSAWETVEGIGKRSGKLGTHCLKALTGRKDLLQEILPSLRGAQIRKQVEAAIAAS